ncbi:MAG: glutathione peroxidase [Bacteroidia bacterium]
MRGSKATEKGKIVENEQEIAPAESIYDFEVELGNGKKLPLSEYINKPLLIVNTASDCGYTGQFDSLQELHQKYGRHLGIIGFPANDFKEQEKGSDSEISEFCKVNYGVTFPIAKKSSVIAGPEQSDIFNWLSSKKRNGWCDQQPIWNFSKYLIDADGSLTGFYGPAVSPEEIPIRSAEKTSA